MKCLCNRWVFVRNPHTSKEIVHFVHEVLPVFAVTLSTFLHMLCGWNYDTMPTFNLFRVHLKCFSIWGSFSWKSVNAWKTLFAFQMPKHITTLTIIEIPSWVWNTEESDDSEADHIPDLWVWNFFFACVPLRRSHGKSSSFNWMLGSIFNVNGEISSNFS